jgi:hypothetical protein
VINRIAITRKLKASSLNSIKTHTHNTQLWAQISIFYNT